MCVRILFQCVVSIRFPNKPRTASVTASGRLFPSRSTTADKQPESNCKDFEENKQTWTIQNEMRTHASTSSNKATRLGKISDSRTMTYFLLCFSNFFSIFCKQTQDTMSFHFCTVRHFPMWLLASRTLGEPWRPSVPRTRAKVRAERASSMARRRLRCMASWSYSSRVNDLSYGLYANARTCGLWINIDSRWKRPSPRYLSAYPYVPYVRFKLTSILYQQTLY